MCRDISCDLLEPQNFDLYLFILLQNQLETSHIWSVFFTENITNSRCTFSVGCFNEMLKYQFLLLKLSCRSSPTSALWLRSLVSLVPTKELQIHSARRVHSAHPWCTTWSKWPHQTPGLSHSGFTKGLMLNRSIRSSSNRTRPEGIYKTLRRTLLI